MRPLLVAPWLLASAPLPPAAACPFLQASQEEREALVLVSGTSHRRLDEHHHRSRLLDELYHRKRKRRRRKHSAQPTSRKSRSSMKRSPSTNGSDSKSAKRAKASNKDSKSAKRSKSRSRSKARPERSPRKPRKTKMPTGAPSPEAPKTSMLLRRERAAFTDGSHAMDDALPNPRDISNAFHSDSPILNSLGATDMLWVFGQASAFFNHDISEVNVIEGDFCNITVPEDDPFLEEVTTIPMSRSKFEFDESNVAQQLTDMTSLADGENVYGTTLERLAYIRSDDSTETGRLRISGNNLLPKNTPGLPNRGPEGREQEMFLAGDVRANENLGLLVAHTLFVREHNHWADYLRETRPTLDGDKVFETARVLVRGIMQKITYDQFIPALLGEGSIPEYTGYKDVDTSLENVVSSCVYRLGHSMVGDTLAKDYGDGTVVHERLEEAFFKPEQLEKEGLDPFLRGLATNQCHEVDPILAPALRNHLFSDQFDLMALNIQRTRDHGIPAFNEIRASIGLGRLDDFQDFLFEQELASVYDNTDQIDCWIGMNAEPRIDGLMVGPTQRAVLARNFANIRDGDPDYYKTSVKDTELLELIEATSFADVIRRNSDFPNSLDDIPENVFFVEER